MVLDLSPSMFSPVGVGLYLNLLAAIVRLKLWRVVQVDMCRVLTRHHHVGFSQFRTFRDIQRAHLPLVDFITEPTFPCISRVRLTESVLITIWLL